MAVPAVGSDLAADIFLPLRKAGFTDEVLQKSAQLGVLEHLPRVAALTRELFGDSFDIRVMEDPEIRDWTHIVFDVRASGSLAEVQKKDEEWHHRLPSAKSCLLLDLQ